MSGLHDLLTEDEIKKVRAPLDQAYWLPNSTFTSPSFFQLEAAQLFAKTWMSVGFEAEAPATGDAHPTTILGGIPIVMVRDEEGELRVFHNVCPRDGVLAIWSPTRSLSYIHGNYHGWTWNLDGTLRNATLFDGKPGVRSVPGHRNANLREIRSAVWQGTVFVNLSGDAQPFDEYIAPVEKLYAGIDLSDLRPGTNREGTEAAIDRFTFDCNWKSVYENFGINVNHEGFVHRDYKASINVPRVTLSGERTFQEVDDRDYHGLRFTEQEADIAYGLARTPRFTCDDGTEHDWNTIMTLYPNTNISLFPNFLLITVLQPQAPDRTDYNSIIFYPEHVASDPRYADQRDIILNEDWGYARNEDAQVLKRVQMGRKSPAFNQHFLVPFWDSMSHGFCNRILDDLDPNTSTR